MSVNQKTYRNIAGIAIMIVSLLCTAVAQEAKAQSTSDSVFLSNSNIVLFDIDKTGITPAEQQGLEEKVIPSLKTLGAGSVIIGRSAASPEGPYENNKRLADGRRETIKAIFEKAGINTARIHFDTAVEEYELLVEMMRQRRDADYPLVKDIVARHAGDDRAIKAALMEERGGALFRRLETQYFPYLRAVRIMVYTDSPSLPREAFRAVTLPVADVPVAMPLALDTLRPLLPLQRREMLSVKTNLLEYGAYVPKYGYCPMPNISLEYYPRHGHITLGASLDFPWWIGNTDNHKYFELRNYTLEARYYTRSSDRSYTHGRPNGDAAFKGFYLSAYANAFL